MVGSDWNRELEIQIFIDSNVGFLVMIACKVSGVFDLEKSNTLLGFLLCFIWGVGAMWR